VFRQAGRCHTAGSLRFPRPIHDAGRTGTPVKVPGKTDSPTTVIGYEVAEQALSVSDASVVVSGGRGASNNTAVDSAVRPG